MRDGAWHWMVCICYGLEGGAIVPHGDVRRHDFGFTLKTLMRAMEISKRAG